jgi:hypothetical protein
MKLISLGVLMFLFSCASMNEEIKGYAGAPRTKMLSQVKGKTPAEVKKIMGEPAAENMCSTCRPEGLYHMVYLNKSVPRYSFALTMANKSNLDCFIMYFYYDETLQKHVYDGTGVMEQTNCVTGAVSMVRGME